jgi:hypothetical protein
MTTYMCSVHRSHATLRYVVLEQERRAASRAKDANMHPPVGLPRWRLVR